MLIEYRQRKESYCLVLEKAKFDYMDAGRILNSLVADYVRSVTAAEMQSQRLAEAVKDHHERFHMASTILLDTYGNSIRHCHTVMHDCQVAKQNVKNAKEEVDGAKEKVSRIYCYVEKLQAKIDEIDENILYLSALQQDKMSGDIFLMTKYGAR